MNLLDKSNNTSILLAGILSIVISLGIARFAFTSLLPSMLDDFLGLTSAGILASLNFAGYLLGAIFTIFLKEINSKVKYFRLGLVLSVLTTFILATTTNEYVWLVARVIAGFGSALLFLIASSLVMLKLNLKEKTKAMGIHFSGIGFAIVISELISQYILKTETWQEVWLTLSILAFVLSFYVVYILSFEKVDVSLPKQKVSKSIFSSYVVLLIVAYFTEGIGFVVQGTFLPDIINSLEGLEGYGNLAWLIVGFAGIPSSIIWMRLADKYNYLDIIMLAMGLQIFGMLIPTFSGNIYLNLLSGVFYGGTFIGLVALFMNLAGKLAKNNPVILMGSMTTAYGIGQVSAPLYSVWLNSYFGNYNSTLYVTASIVFLGIILLFYIKKLVPSSLD